MDNKEAVRVLKEILDRCPQVDASNVFVMPSNANNMQVQGTQLHLTTTLDNNARKCMVQIMKKHHLAMKEEADKIIVYQPAT